MRHEAGLRRLELVSDDGNVRFRIAAEEAKTADLRQAFEDHLKQTKGHVKRLEEVFQELDVSDREKKCKGMQALIQEGEEMMKRASDAMTRDAALIAAAQRVEHYEMAG